MTRPSANNEAVLRMFVAIHLPPSIRSCATGLIDGCRTQLPGHSVRWAKPENAHLTLRFIGNVPTHDLEEVKASLARAVRGARPLSLQVDRLGCFPQTRSPRVLWLGVQGDLEPLSVLQSRVCVETSAWGRSEDRRFHPHLTLGRVLTKKRAELERVAAALHDVEVPPSDPWSVEAVHLMQSELSSAGSIYSILASVPLPG